ncbi:1523_t:CDS:2 [Acaulospora colombiana]|uniref:1523_t:CDS:1 n=1 Tax=Acaulospora colombiana TaxID=27376 RepID=A0ACA9KIW7_9GLOM|nr:1523_t:CDS:2 [Acaulospora colombiana]
MTKSHLNFELSTTSPAIAIPARKVLYRASVQETRTSPITGNPIFDSKQMTTNFHPSSETDSLESNRISSSLTTLTLSEIETSRSPNGLSPRTRSLSYTKGTRGSSGGHFGRTSSLARNPFSDCEIFTAEGLKPLIESNATRLSNGSNESLGETRGSSKPAVLQDKKSGSVEKKLRRKSSWDIVELLALDNFRNWMVCFCVVNFDLELGQAIDSMYPPLELGDEEKKNICFSSFPDSNSFDVGDTIRASEGFESSRETLEAKYLTRKYPFVGLFSRVVSILGPSYFEVGKPMLEAACHDIARWFVNYHWFRLDEEIDQIDAN